MKERHESEEKEVQKRREAREQKLKERREQLASQPSAMEVDSNSSDAKQPQPASAESEKKAADVDGDVAMGDASQQPPPPVKLESKPDALKDSELLTAEEREEAEQDETNLTAFRVESEDLQEKKAALQKRIEESTPNRDKLQQRKKELDAELSQRKRQSDEAVRAMKRLCALARNKYSKTQLQRVCAVAVPTSERRLAGLLGWHSRDVRRIGAVRLLSLSMNDEGHYRRKSKHSSFSSSSSSSSSSSAAKESADRIKQKVAHTCVYALIACCG